MRGGVWSRVASHAAGPLLAAGARAAAILRQLLHRRPEPSLLPAAHPSSPPAHGRVCPREPA